MDCATSGNDGKRSRQPDPLPSILPARFGRQSSPVNPLSCAPARLALALAALAFVFVSSHALAQDTLVVAPGAFWNMDDQAAADLVEESAFLAEDHGGFLVSRAYQLEASLRTDSFDRLMNCAGVADCYADALYRTGYHWVLAVTLEDTGREVFVQYQLIDIRTGTLHDEALVTLSSTTDFAALEAPVFGILASTGTARRSDATPEPVASGAAPGDATWDAGLYDTTPAWSPPERGALGRAGIYTAIAGGVIGFGGVLLGFSADNIQQEIQARPRPRAELEDLQAQGESRQTLANVAFAIGGVAVATGITLVIVDTATRRNERAPQGGMGINIRAGAVPGGGFLRAEF